MSSKPHTGPLRAAVVSVGNELLFGETVDTNAAWLGRRLSSEGVTVVRRFTAPDDVGAIQECVTSAMRSAELVVITGGLGPTPDDVTRDAVATLFESPEGARVLKNPIGTAPGIAMDVAGGAVVLFPGVPREMKAIFDGDFLALLRERYADQMAPTWHRLIHTSGVPESQLAELIGEALPDLDRELGNRISLAYLPDLRGVDMRVSAHSSSRAQAERELDRAEALLAPVVAPWRFRAASGDMAEAVLDSLRESGETLAVAESCTAGMISARLTRQAGASDVFLGGVVSYANEVKEALLGVPRPVMVEFGAVSEPVARHMAEGARITLGASIGVGITGVAGPGGGTEEKPVGTVWLAVAGPRGIVSETACFSGDRHAVRERTTQAALVLAQKYLLHMGEGL